MRAGQPHHCGTLPLLFRFASPRIEGLEMQGRYDSKLQVWVLDTPAGARPLVEVGSPRLLETQTVTRTRPEADDEDISRDEKLAGSLLETHTYTKVQAESDDEDMSNGDPALRDAHHKHADEVAEARILVELETRSANNQEGVDDDDFPFIAAAGQIRGEGTPRAH